MLDLEIMSLSVSLSCVTMRSVILLLQCLSSLECLSRMLVCVDRMLFTVSSVVVMLYVVDAVTSVSSSTVFFCSMVYLRGYYCLR